MVTKQPIPRRCPWAIHLATMSTRCLLPDDWHLMHEGRGLAMFEGQRLSWFGGDLREFRSDRPDEHAWDDWS